MNTSTPDLMKGCARLPGEAVNHEGYRRLVGRWAPINQAPGGLLVYDTTRRGPPGALVNIAVGAWESSHLGPVLDYGFAGSNILVPFRAELEPLEVTVRVVFRSGAAVGNHVVYKGPGGGQIDYNLRLLGAGNIRVAFNDGVARNHDSAAGLIAASTWYDITFTIGNGRLRAWLDGAMVVDDAEANAMPQTGADLNFGPSVGDTSFKGKLALVEIWNYCLPKPLSQDPHFLAYAR